MMRRDPSIKLNSVVGRMIGFTTDYFSHGTLWNALPAGIYITDVFPLEGKEDEAIEQMLVKYEELRIRTRFIAPSQLVIKHLKSHGYFYYVDSAGCPNWVRLSEKGLSALCGKLRLSPDQVKQQSKDYAV